MLRVPPVIKAVLPLSGNVAFMWVLVS